MTDLPGIRICLLLLALKFGTTFLLKKDYHLNPTNNSWLVCLELFLQPVLSRQAARHVLPCSMSCWPSHLQSVDGEGSLVIIILLVIVDYTVGLWMGLREGGHESRAARKRGICSWVSIEDLCSGADTWAFEYCVCHLAVWCFLW